MKKFVYLFIVDDDDDDLDDDDEMCVHSDVWRRIYPHSDIYHPDSVNRARITAFSDHFNLLFLLIVNLIVYASPLCAPFLLFSSPPRSRLQLKQFLCVKMRRCIAWYMLYTARCPESHFTIRSASWLSVLCCVLCVDRLFFLTLFLTPLHTPIHTRFH